MNCSKTENKLAYVNTHVYGYYSVNGERVRTLESVRIEGKPYKVTAKLVDVPFMDGGREYSVKVTHYFITRNVFGKRKQLDLHSVAVSEEVYANIFTLEKR